MPLAPDGASPDLLVVFHAVTLGTVSDALGAVVCHLANWFHSLICLQSGYSSNQPEAHESSAHSGTTDQLYIQPLLVWIRTHA